MYRRSSTQEEIVMKFDFDYWANLARTNPAQFDKERRQALQEAIDIAPPEKRAKLELLAYRVNEMITYSVSPKAAIETSFQMMTDSLCDQNSQFAKLATLVQHHRELAASVRS